MTFERGRFEFILKSQRQDDPDPDAKPIKELSDDELIAEVDHRFGKNWARHAEWK